jgi:hypothetical protein
VLRTWSALRWIWDGPSQLSHWHAYSTGYERQFLSENMFECWSNSMERNGPNKFLIQSTCTIMKSWTVNEEFSWTVPVFWVTLISQSIWLVKKVLSWTVLIDQPNTHIFLFDSCYLTIIQRFILKKLKLCLNEDDYVVYRLCKFQVIIDIFEFFRIF